MPIIDVPVELLRDFKRDPAGSARKFAAISVSAIQPFFSDYDALRKCIDFKRQNPFNDTTLTFDDSFHCQYTFNHYLCCDLSNTQNATGLCMVHVPRFVAVEVVGTTAKVAPFFKVDFLAKIRPQNLPGKRINYAAIREVIISVRDKYGYNVSIITFDQFQSADSVMILRERGFLVETMSIDRTVHGWALDIHAQNHLVKYSTGGSYAMPFMDMREAVSDGRLDVPAYGPMELNHFEVEARGLELKGDVVEKSEHSEDDMVQPMAGALFLANINERYTQGRELVDAAKMNRGPAQIVDGMLSVHSEELDIGLSGSFNEDFGYENDPYFADTENDWE